MNFKLNPNPFSQSKVKPSRLSSLLLPPTPIITHHILTAKYLLSASHTASSGAGQIHPGFPALGFLYVLSRSLGIFFSLLIRFVPFHLLDSASMTCLKESFQRHSIGGETSPPHTLILHPVAWSLLSS